MTTNEQEQRDLVLVRFGELSLNSTSLDEILTEACELVGQALGTDLAKVVELEAGGKTLFVRAGVGWKPGVVGKVRLPMSERSSETYALTAGEPVISADIRTETRFQYPDFLTDNGVRALINVPIVGSKGRPAFGILQVDSRTPREFSGSDILFLRGYANLLAASVARVNALDQLQEKNARLEETIAEQRSSAERHMVLSGEMILEIAERKRYQAELEQQAALLDLVRDSIIVRDLDGCVRYWNRSAERMFGWTAAEAMGRPVRDLLYVDPPEGKPSYETVLTNGQWSGQVPVHHKDGRRMVVDARLTLLRDDNGAPRAILGVNTDVTERLEIEHRLRQSQRLEAVGQLTGGIAHDFNNLLTVILGNAEMLTESDEVGPSAKAMADMMLRAAERGAALTGQLLAFSRRQALAPRSIDVGQLLLELSRMVRRTLGEHIEIGIVSSPGLWHAFIDPLQLEHAMLNLCINARDAMPSGGKLVITTNNVALDEDYTATEFEVVAGDYVMISVSDNGTGMTAKTLARAFEPYFTTKEVGHGSGLGLSMVFGFLKQSGGHVKIYSEPGIGTQINMYLPRDASDERLTADRGGDHLGDLPRGTERLMLVEDDPIVREHVARQLRGLGYSLMEASDATSALLALRSDQRIDLLFTDVVMPGGMNGAELAAAARQLRPGLPVLFSSGYTAGASGLHGTLGADALLLSKPYRRRELAEKVRQALDGIPAD